MPSLPNPITSHADRPTLHQGGTRPKTLLDALPFAIWSCDSAGRIICCNETAKAWFPIARTLDSVLAGTRILGPFDGWSHEIARILASDDGRDAEYLVLRSARSSGSGQLCAGVEIAQPPIGDGPTPRLFRLRARRCNGDTTAPLGAVVLWAEPIHESAAPNDALDATDRLSSFGKLAARVVHELNNPLDGILRYVNLAMRMAAGHSEDKLRSYLSESRAGLLRMMRILGDLLDRTRDSASDPERVDVNEVIDAALRAHAAIAESTGVIVATNFRTSPLPSARGNRLYQILANLIRNALDAMPTGGRLTITSELLDGHIVIEVTDTGVGLPPATEKVFEPYFTTKPPGRGTGLGLAICRDYTAEMNGTITASHGVSGGAAFTVRIPATGLDQPPRHQHRPAPGSGTSAPRSE